VTAQELTSAYKADYGQYKLAEWAELGSSPEKDSYALSLKRVVGTDLTRLLYQTDGKRLYLFSLIDNLVKGASGQAIENFNAIHGWDFSLGLENLEGVL
jgi:N-acetyl-gamma-glutamylphosphate reductase